jgi:uncharacterized membrane protein HdeD (DUF308 family)
MQVTKNASRLISGIVLILMGVLQMMQKVQFDAWLVVLIIGIMVLVEAQSR